MSTNNKRDVPEERIKQEYRVTEGFFKVLQSRVDQLANGQGVSKFELEEPERKVLMQINNSGLMKGTAAGLLSLVFLRRVRSNMWNRVVKRMQDEQLKKGFTVNTNSGHHVGNSPFQSQQPGAPLPGSSPLEKALRRRQNPWSLTNLLGWFLDVSVSFFVAATASVYFTDRKLVLQSLSTLPLIEGKSRVSAEFCPSMLEHYNRLRMQPETADLVQNPQTDYLKAIQAFCINCQRRRQQETRLRETMGMSSSAVVSIPPPGVNVSEDEIDLWKEVGNKDNGDTEFYLTEDEDPSQWADDFVTGQGESGDPE